MNLKKHFCHSLLTRLILLGSVVVLCSALLRYYLLIDFLHKEQTIIVAEQQNIIANDLAQDLNLRLLERRHLLEQLALTLSPKLLDRPRQLSHWLQEQQALHSLLEMELHITDTSGHILAATPPMHGRTTIHIPAYQDMQHAQNGVFVIGEPLFSPMSQLPVLPMLAPIQDASNHTVAVLSGTTALKTINFQNHLQATLLGESGNFIVVSPLKRMIIASNDTRLILQPLPAVGTDMLLDKAVNGYRGNGVGLHGSSKYPIRAVAAIPSTGWFVAVRLPVVASPAMTQAQALILRGSLIQASVIFFFIILTVLWFFRPLRHAAAQADKMTRGELPLVPLPVTRNNEIGHLTLAFNRLLSRLKIHQATLQHQAHHDLLTGLPNRTMLADRMQQAIAHAHHEQTGVALLFLDLDGFKSINDTFGHQCGDQVLQEIAQRLLRVARHRDTLARVGGDEFILLANDLEIPLECGARALAEKCISAVAEPLRVQQTDCKLGVSIGIAVCAGLCDVELLLHAADTAMYDAKNQGRGCYVIAC